uniref:NADH-ubiquinone oxidoreductase chain 3 n=1 Tax=Graptacme eborea TaxID=55752 RepID=Q68SP9_GRAEB|nr:NADH dehydrogenase subunit 3 [Graptacme eborea]AAT98398.1 NADH dehydrogenase subunit 3 [Graptacme eborea]
MLILFSGIMAILISIFLMIISFFISFNMKENYEKSSPFECGFDPMSKNRLPFSIRFFMLAIIFLIFDLEIVLLLPFLLNKMFLNEVNTIFLMNFFIFILLLGTLYEWKKGALSWIN